MISFTAKQMHGTGRRSGFTIIELLVAVAITAVMAGILLAMTSGVLQAWNRTSGSLSANSQAQLVFDTIKEDLQSAVYRTDGGVWLAIDVLDNTTAINGRDWTVSSGSGKYKPAGTVSQAREDERLAKCRYGLGGSWLRFFTTGGGSQPRAVAYQLARRKVTGDPTDNTNPAEVRYMLYRTDMGPSDTFNRGYNLDPNPLPLAPAPKSGYADAAGNSLISPPGGEVIANNVVDFGIRLHYRNGANVIPVFPVSASEEWDDGDLQYLADGTPANRFPDVVDVMVRILTEEGAQQILNLEEGRLPPEGNDFDEAWWNIVEANSRVFTQRIYVNTRPF